MENQPLNIITANETRIRAVLAEKGLPSKLGVHLTINETKLHSIICSTYNFKTGTSKLEIPAKLLNECSDQFRVIWDIHTQNPLPATPKIVVFFTLTASATQQTIRTALVKDESIFNGKTDQVKLHHTWARFLQHKATPSTSSAPPVDIDWSKAARAAETFNATVTQAINDGKTFNARKDNPWARKHLKNKNQ